MSVKDLIIESLYAQLSEHLSKEEIDKLIEKPSNSEYGDYAFPVFTLAKIYRMAPNLIAEKVAAEIDSNLFEKINVVGAYINFFIKREEHAQNVIAEIIEKGQDYGRTDIGKNGNVPIDMSSPNIAKPMSMGHLRSTVLGESIALILEKINYKPIRINHLGDWGTQFGKLIVAYKGWGDEETVKSDPVNELVKLYVDFHEKAEENPELDDQARQAFKKLEDGDPEYTELWNWFKEESINEFKRVYQLLNINFDYYTGESFYNDKMGEILDLLEEKKISKIEQGATIVDLSKYDLPVALIKKSDGATLYLTRDLATAYYRKRTFDFVKSLYVVGNEQSDHFKQLKAVLKELGNEWSDDMHHIPFGLITLNGKKLSTRKGKIVLLEKVLLEAIEIADKQITAKNPDIENKDEIAKQVGVGAVVFHDLKSDRQNTFDFNLNDIVQFEGETGPYIQYTYARLNTILRKYGKEVATDHPYRLNDEHSWEIVKLLQQYPEVIIRAAEQFEPSVIAKYAISLAQLSNKYYAKVRILDENEELESRIQLVKAITIVLKDALSLLGIAAPEKM
ncbi:arginine--tRNA ligase [Facklamia sp. DSM 111018]|uniref:Arginine--tRNA ligase n=1 Tax=Facklamia lactis TaxID=2749967 RepID=A0ABS0LP69_9LACT|nr:arginine--tRNA ligase [Facklamia lactis]MBG9980132.1 arginine--tRNA ligase [Facklamia lactis]MBG9985934.1 arginine--tRNA ligase [Facklamia lactis]